jgi:hypothetical protein
MFITVKFVYGTATVIGNAWNTIKYCLNVVNVAVRASALVDFGETNAEFAACSHCLNALSVQRPMYLHLNLNATCAPILVKNPMNAISVLSDVLQPVL